MRQDWLATDVLMENAGRAVAEAVKQILGDIKKQRLIILIGPGNNGGDGLVTARHLHDWGAKVNLCLLSQRPGDDPNLALVQERKIPCFEATQTEDLDKLDELLPSANAVIDAVFGTGKSRPLRGVFLQALNRVSQAKRKYPGLCLIALDLPSGLDADTGETDPACLYVDNTITLGFPKPGLFNFPGAERAGKITVVDIGMPDYLAKGIANELLTSEWAKSVPPLTRISPWNCFPPRRQVYTPTVQSI